MSAETRSIYSGQVRRALDRLERQIAEGGNGNGTGVNEVTIGGTSPTDTSELWVDNTPAIRAKIGGNWVPVSGPAGAPGVQGNPGAPGAPGPPGPPGETEEVWIGPSPPTVDTIELWFDTDAPPATTPTTLIVAVPFDDWPPADPQPDVLYLRITP